MQNSTVGKVVAALVVPLVLIGIGFSWYRIERARSTITLEYVTEQIEPSERINNRCDWLITIRVNNDANHDLNFRRSTIVVGRQRLGAYLSLGADRIVAGESGHYVLIARIPELDTGRCPELDQIEHGTMVIEFHDPEAERGFSF